MRVDLMRVDGVMRIDLETVIFKPVSVWKGENAQH